MKLLDDSGLWKLNVYCTADDPSLTTDERIGCMNLYEITEDDIECLEYYYTTRGGKDYGEYVVAYLFTCPNCGKKTVIPNRLIPPEIEERLKKQEPTLRRKIYNPYNKR